MVRLGLRLESGRGMSKGSNVRGRQTVLHSGIVAINSAVNV